jgi:hypothetical protein
MSVECSTSSTTGEVTSTSRRFGVRGQGRLMVDFTRRRREVILATSSTMTSICNLPRSEETPPPIPDGFRLEFHACPDKDFHSAIAMPMTSLFVRSNYIGCQRSAATNRHPFRSRAQSYVVVELRLANGAKASASQHSADRAGARSVEGIGRRSTLTSHRRDRRRGVVRRAGISWTRRQSATTRPRRQSTPRPWTQWGGRWAVGRRRAAAVRDRIPCFVSSGFRRAGSGDRGGRAKIEARLHNTFKVKIGAQTPGRTRAHGPSREGAGGRASLTVDNQAWTKRARHGACRSWVMGCIGRAAGAGVECGRASSSARAPSRR